MKRVILFVPVVIILVLLGYRFVQHRQVPDVKTIAQIQESEGYPVEVMPAQVQKFIMQRRYAGTVVGGEEAAVVSSLGEYIAAVKVSEGQWVEQDQVVCELSRDNPAARYRTAELALDNARRELERIQSLYNQGAVSKQVLDGVTLQRDMAQENLSAVERLLYVRTPISGRIAELTAEAGTFALPGAPLARVVSEGRMRVMIDVPAADRNLVKPGASAHLTAEGVSVPGRVTRVAWSADSKARSFTAWIEMTGKTAGFAFSPGLLVDAVVGVVEVEQALTVSPDALVRSGDLYHVFVVENNRAHRCEVQLGGRNADAAWITSGLASGAVTVVGGSNLLYDGAPVRIITRG